VKGRTPLRIVADSKLRIPLKAKVLKEQGMAHTIVASTSKANKKKLAALKRMGIGVLTIKKDNDGMVDLRALLRVLGRQNISSVLVEGGATTITSFTRQRLADKVIVIIAPKIIGKGVEAVGDLGIREVKNALKLSLDRVYRRGEDLVIEASVR
jgi:riboflavin-specific deaminase-like protein